MGVIIKKMEKNMKKIIITLLCLLLCCGCGPEAEPEPEPEPLYYSDEIRIVTKKLNSVEELSEKVLAVQETFDKEYSDYVIEQLATQGVELSEENLHWFTTYADIKFLIDDGSIDAWVIVGDREDIISDYRDDYKKSDYKTLASFYKPYYEEKVVDTSNLVKELYEEPFVVMLNGLDCYGQNSVHEWSKNNNDVNHLLVVNPKLKHILIVSIPRDTRILNVETGNYDKFTHFCRNGAQNPANSIGKLLDVDVPYYCITSFTWFVYGINELGGVTIDVPMDAHLDMDSNRDVANPQYYKKGISHIFGETALALARNRKYNGIVNSDMGRIRNQALIIDGLIEKIANHPYILSMVGMSWLMDYLCENNFSAKEKTTLFELAKTFEDGYTIDNFFMDGYDDIINGIWYCTPYKANIEIAKGKIKLALTGEIDEDDPYYEDILEGYVTGGAGTVNDGERGYIGTYYDLRDVFFKEEIEDTTGQS